ncbi:tungstate transport system ATP-binding protein [Paucibacter oligotrophus]|uniref:Tungstate transport system ATP-binding protein n=1 Tax=Roseateles oligotrophus TaxID=1769250 RepID=A0A840KZY5_9BURK|nr:ATP-binding cassette domain-containing protein [Roseateles oligotrophus]MBB4841560.1 tungstate transport system ATP-binding protein [Roseateles oligotrophus]
MSSSSSLLLQLRGCRLELGGRQVLAPLDLALRRGERLALLGSNGAGKTSLLRLMHGLLPAPGRVLHVLPELGRPPRQAMVFQQPFFLHLSVRSNLRLALALARQPWRLHEAMLESALRRVGLLDQAGQLASHLSGGQRQRLALARAWALRPDLLFMDEPTAHLDPGARREVERLIASFAEEGMTWVMSTHNLGQAKRLASRVLYLEAGRVLADAPVQAFFQQPQGRAVDQFLKGEWL